MPKKKYSSYIKGGKVKDKELSQREAENKAIGESLARAEARSEKKKVAYRKKHPIKARVKGAVARVKRATSGYTGGSWNPDDIPPKKYKKKKLNRGGKADTVSAMLTPGEVVLNAKQQEKLGKLVGLSSSELFSKIGVPGFEDGGKVKKKKQTDSEKMPHGMYKFSKWGEQFRNVKSEKPKKKVKYKKVKLKKKPY